MEEILLNIDSRYRDVLKYPNECKFTLNLEKTYKNIISARMVSNEINNNIKYIDSTKNNNYITVHVPNKLNDPDGTRLELSDGLLQAIQPIQNLFNALLTFLYNSNASLTQYKVDDKPYAEKNFYIFYLNSSITLGFDFNNENKPQSLSEKLTINEGWHSVYGLVLQIQKYIKQKYDEREIYVKTNKIANNEIIDLDSGKFKLQPFDIPVFDRRFRNIDLIKKIPTKFDCVRIDNFIPKGNDGNGSYTDNLIKNLDLLKTNIYKFYIYNTITFLTTSNIPEEDMGILDLLVNNKYLIPPGYLEENTNLLSSSKYYINNYDYKNPPTQPTNNSLQLYNMQMKVDYTSLKVSFVNTMTEDTSGEGLLFCYYWVDPSNSSPSSWSYPNASDPTGKTYSNELSNLVSKNYLYDQMFITREQYINYSYKPNLIKDIPQFQIDFQTNKIMNPIVNGIIDVKRMTYPSVGYYMGYRPDIKKEDDKFLLTPIWDETDLQLNATKIFDTTGDDYIFVKINDWGYIDFFNKPYFAKIILTTSLGNPQLNDYVNKEYRFRQPINVNRLDIELVDYLGNTLDMNGSDYSFTLEFRQMVNSDQKNTYERNNLVFTGYTS